METPVQAPKTPKAQGFEKTPLWGSAACRGFKRRSRECGTNERSMDMDSLSLYIHIPFCVRKCAYCDFVSRPAEPAAMEIFTEALFKEFEARAALLERRRVTSVFVGGGTPSLMSASFHERLMETVSGLCHLSGDAEITLEANPESLIERDSDRLKGAGYNRISIGVQSFDDRLLRRLGRVHDSRQALAAFTCARKAGFENINIDLMYGLPGQSLELWERDLETAGGLLEPEHISAYSLIVNRDTPMAALQDATPDLFPSEEAERAMHHLCTRMLAQKGYEHYEVSNYARAGSECRHNLAYWTRLDYLGFGPAAHSFLNPVRFHNADSLEAYVRDVEEGLVEGRDRERLSDRDALTEEIFLGLRLTRGLDAALLERRYGIRFQSFFKSPIRSMGAAGLTRFEGGRLRLTVKGMDLADRVALEFLRVIDQNN